MNTVIEAIREKYPEYNDVPDDKLTLAIGQKYPEYLERQDFKNDFGIVATTNLPDIRNLAPLASPQAAEQQRLAESQAQGMGILEVTPGVPGPKLPRIPQSPEVGKQLGPAAQGYYDVTSGIGNFALGLAEFMLQPENAGFWAMPYSAPARAALAPVLAKDIISNAPESAKRIGESLATGDNQTATTEIANLAGSGFIAKSLIGSHAAPPDPRMEIIHSIQDTLKRPIGGDIDAAAREALSQRAGELQAPLIPERAPPVTPTPEPMGTFQRGSVVPMDWTIVEPPKQPSQQTTPIPARLRQPIVPETPPEPQRGMTVLQEIRQKGARTKEQIRGIFPQLSREQAAELRRLAWPEDVINKPQPPVNPTVQNITQGITQALAEGDLKAVKKLARSIPEEFTGVSESVFDLDRLNDVVPEAKPPAVETKLPPVETGATTRSESPIAESERTLVTGEAATSPPPDISQAKPEVKETQTAQKAETQKPDFIADNTHSIGSREWRIANSIGEDWTVTETGDGGWVAESPVTKTKGEWGKMVKTSDSKGNGKMLGVKTEAPAPPPPAPTAKAKEPWEMSGVELKSLADKLLAERKNGGSVAAPFEAWQVIKKAYVDYAKIEGRGPIKAARSHEGIVKRAIERGDPVPPEVLADYPDLAPKETTVKERLIIAPRTDGFVSLQDVNRANIGTFKTADEAAQWAKENGYEIAAGSLLKPKPSEKYIVVGTNSHRDVNRLHREIPSASGGIPVSLGSKTRAWRILDIPENREKVKKLGLNIRVKDTNYANKIASELSQLNQPSPDLSGPGTPSAVQGEGTPIPPEHQGPGAASPSDQPAAPPQAVAAGAKVEQAPPEARPAGPVHPVSVAIRNALGRLQSTLKGIAGDSMPKTTAANREAGEAGVRYGSSRIAARPLAQTFVANALEGTNVDPVKLGAALTEDNLRSIRESFRAQATKLLSEGKEEEAALATEQADQVSTIIGSKGSPFQTEEAYFDFLENPSVKKAIDQHIQLWQEIIDPQYKEAQSLDPDVELPSRGQQTGARINLKAILEDENGVKPVQSGMGGVSLTRTFKRKSPFAVKAKGTGKVYDVDYSEIIANTFERQLEIANKNVFDKKLVESGNAVIDKPGKRIEIKGEPTVPFPLKRKTIVHEEGSFPLAENIYVRKSLANEYRIVSNIDPQFKIPFVTSVMGFLNKMALAGLTDFTVHLSNQMTALFNRPISGGLFRDTLLSATGRADVPVTLVKAVLKAYQNNQAQISELAEIGALREPHLGQNFMGRILHKTDTITRLMLDDTFKQLAKDGLVENTETARREYVNQIGQYNRRLQGRFTRFLRDTGFGPFVTAGKTFNAMGVKMATLSPNARATNNFAAAALRANVLAKWIGAIGVLVPTLNYLITGSMYGRPGVPIGDIDSGKSDKTGKILSFPLLSILGLGRALRVTGVKGAMESKRLGLTSADMMDSAARDIVNSWTAPAAGPPVKFGVVSASGYPPAINVGRESRVAPPGSSQIAENLKSALLDANPIVISAVKAYEGKTVPEILSSQLPRFTLVPRKSPALAQNYPKIVSMAQGNAFIEDIVYQGRRLPQEEKLAFINEQIKRLPPNQRAHARSEIKRRRVMRPNR